MARQRVVFALTYSVRDEYYHHLLIKNGAAGDFLLNEGSLGCMYLDEAIRKFQERRYPGLATRLESDPRSRRTFVPEHSSGSRWRDDARRHHGSRDERGASRDRKIHGKKKKKATKKKKKRRNR